MRLRSTEWRRIAILSCVTLLVLAVLVYRGGGSNDEPETTPEATVEEAEDLPTASSQVEESSAEGAAGAEIEVPTPAEEETEVVSSGAGTFTGALTGPIQFGEPNPTIEVQFSVAVEDGIGVEATDLALFVDQVLSDPRSWASSPEYSLVRVPTGGAFQLVITSPDTTDQVCAPLQTIGQLSCSLNGVVAINLTRWETGSREWPGTLEEYRQWVVNHEVGHQLGLEHRNCEGVDVLADVMQQQSLALDGCLHNPWPFPDAVAADASEPAEDDAGG